MILIGLDEGVYVKLKSAEEIFDIDQNVITTAHGRFTREFYIYDGIYIICEVLSSALRISLPDDRRVTIPSSFIAEVLTKEKYPEYYL